MIAVWLPFRPRLNKNSASSHESMEQKSTDSQICLQNPNQMLSKLNDLL